MAKNQKIGVVAATKKLTGLGLKEAKDLVEELLPELGRNRPVVDAIPFPTLQEPQKLEEQEKLDESKSPLT